MSACMHVVVWRVWNWMRVLMSACVLWCMYVAVNANAGVRTGDVVVCVYVCFVYVL